MILGIHYALEKAVYMNQLKGVYIQEKNIEVKRYSIGQGLTNPYANPQGNPHNPHDKQHETKNATELEACVNYLVDKRGFDRADAIYYCKTLGSQWQELVDEE
jgi:hypothetical protein